MSYLSDERMRESLLWLAERVERLRVAHGLEKPTSPCVACGHSRTAHVINGDADNPTPWPCAYPKNLGAPHALCSCLDYLPQEADPDEPINVII